MERLPPLLIGLKSKKQMNMGVLMKNKWKKWIVLFLLPIFCFGLLSPLANVLVATAASKLLVEQPVLVITGDRLIGSEYSSDTTANEVSYTLAELKSLAGADTLAAKDNRYLYSALNTYDNKSIYTGEGIRVDTLLSRSGLSAEKLEKTKLQFVASDGYLVTFDPEKTTIGDKSQASSSQTITKERCYYPQFATGSEQNAVEVPTILAWANGGEKGVTDIPTAVQNLDYLLLMTGQLNTKDYNHSLYNKQVQRIVAGNELKEIVLTIDGKKYTRSEILLLPRAEKEYSYTNSGGTVVKRYAKGVSMETLLKDYEDQAVVSFTASDGYAIDSLTKKELVAGNYILAYEDGETKETCKGIYENAKKDPTKFGFFTLYGDEAVPSKLIDRLKFSKGDGDTGSYADSPYKHITNGGITGQDGPYQIDAITGATLTIEGPGVKQSVPMPVLELESQNAGIHRGAYQDLRDGKKQKLTYEGVRLLYLLQNMTKGENGIALTDSAYGVEVKNRNRQTIASFTIDQLIEAEKAGKPVLVAYGVSNGDKTAPFVFDGASGYFPNLFNDDGCLKLVYDSLSIKEDQNPAYQTFGNMAYIYVTEQKTPGYKHKGSVYGTPENLWYPLAVTGSLLEREVNYTVKQLEEMVSYNKKGNISKNSIGYRNEYSLANSTYWYVNEYEGVKLYDLLLKSGLKSSAASDAKTKKEVVYFSATDGYTAFDQFTLAQLSDQNQFGYYEKNPLDPGDGSFKGLASDLKKKGFPVLVAYGVNRYPYVQKPAAKGYLSGLSNDGGPLRIISGKINYAHANGSNQAKFLDKVVVGKEIAYSTHLYNPTQNGAYQKLAKETKFSVEVQAGTGKTTKTMKKEVFSLGDLEDLLYGKTLNKTQLAEAKIKQYYETSKNGTISNDLYEGLNLSYLLTEVVQLPGTQGRIAFLDDKGKELELDLEQVIGYAGVNRTTGMEGLSPILAFAKNGMPLVASKDEKGYEGTTELENGYTYKVNNEGGPLCLIFPRKSNNAKQVDTVFSISSIRITLAADNYAHVSEPYVSLADQQITVFGEGTRLEKKKTFTVANLEDKQNLIITKDYSILDQAGKLTERRFRGLNLYEFLKSTDVLLKSNAAKVILTAQDGTKVKLSLSDLTKTDYINRNNKKQKNLPVLLAYGSSSVRKKSLEDGKPLVASNKEKGYQKAYQNSGGPLMLVVGQKNKQDENSGKLLKNIVSIEVTASKQTTWNHSMSAIYEQQKDYPFVLQVVNKDNKTVLDKTFTVAELEAMTEFVEREDITWVGTQEWEGLNLWKFLQSVAGNIDGMDDPSMITAVAEDGFSKELRSIFGMDALKNGIKDGTRRVPILLAYATRGYPLVPSNVSDGYTSLADNSYGPLRLMTHGNQGACLKNANKIVVKVATDGKIKMVQKKTKKAPKIITYPADGSSLPLAGLRDLDFDPAGGFYVGTYGGGMAYQAADKKDFVLYHKESEISLKNTYISALAADAEGGVWFSQNASYTDPTKNEGIGYLKDGTIAYYTKEQDNTIPDNYVQAIEIAKDGTVWFGSFGGITRYNKKTSEWKTWTKEDGLPAASVNTIVLDEKGGVWIGCYPDFETVEAGPFTGGYAYLDKKGKITAYPTGVKETIDPARLADSWVRSIALDQKGGAWVVRSGSYADLENVGGRIDYVDKKGRVTHYTGKKLLGKRLKGNTEVRVVSVDENGHLWFGTSGSGIIRCTKKGKPEEVYRFGKQQNNVLFDNIFTMNWNNNTLYLGSNGGLQVIPGSSLK